MSRLVGRRAAAWAGAMLATAALGHAAGAQAPSPRPSATAAPTPAAFTAHAHANVTVVTPSATFNASLQLGLAQRTNLTRIDVLSVKSDTLPIPPIGLTAVIDRGANTVTIWNDAAKQYRVQPFSLPSAQPSPRPGASHPALTARRGASRRRSRTSTSWR